MEKRLKIMFSLGKLLSTLSTRQPQLCCLWGKSHQIGMQKLTSKEGSAKRGNWQHTEHFPSQSPCCGIWWIPSCSLRQTCQVSCTDWLCVSHSVTTCTADFCTAVPRLRSHFWVPHRCRCSVIIWPAASAVRVKEQKKGHSPASAAGECAL